MYIYIGFIYEYVYQIYIITYIHNNIFLDQYIIISRSIPNARQKWRCRLYHQIVANRKFCDMK